MNTFDITTYIALTVKIQNLEIAQVIYYKNEHPGQNTFRQNVLSWICPFGIDVY